MRRTSALVPLVLVPVVTASMLLTSSAGGAPSADPSVVGSFASPFQEPGQACTKDADPKTCVPAGVSVVVLPNGKIAYWDGLEGTDDVRLAYGAEFGHLARNSKSRILDLRGPSPTWTVPTPEDGGANPNGNRNEYLPLVPHDNTNKDNDGDLFCSGQVLLSDGRVLTVGGSSYYQEPGTPLAPDIGASELEGLKNSRILDPATNRWSQSGSMQYGRWYPTLVTLPNGRVFVASGVTKLMKPLYPDRLADSGANVRQTEIYDPAAGRWTTNPASANRTLPLYPRLHLLPNGKVYYDAGGQTFNPQGYAIDEALWNTTSVYDPAKQTWRDLGVPTFGGAPLGFRGSGFSQMLPLKAPYTKAQFLAAGGVYGTTPGTYLATDTSTLNTVDMSGPVEAFTSEATGKLTTPRWYSTGVSLPTGEVLAFSGANRDETNLPASGNPVTQAELYDPATKTWRPLAMGNKGRTYHNTAVLLPDGRVLVGGHAPLGSYYLNNRLGDVTHAVGGSDPQPDPTFEIYSPPNLFYGPRPVITDAPSSVPYGQTMRIGVDDPASVESVVVVRNTAITHLTDADQRTVDLPVISRDATSVTVQTPPRAAVAPVGPYMLFVNKKTPQGLTPSVSRQVFVGRQAPAQTAVAGAGQSTDAPDSATAAALSPAAGVTPAQVLDMRASSGSMVMLGGVPAVAAVATRPWAVRRRSWIFRSR